MSKVAHDVMTVEKLRAAKREFRAELSVVAQMQEVRREAALSRIRTCLPVRAQPRYKSRTKASTALCWPGGVQFGGFRRALQV